MVRVQCDYCGDVYPNKDDIKRLGAAVARGIDFQRRAMELGWEIEKDNNKPIANICDSCKDKRVRGDEMKFLSRAELEAKWEEQR